MAARKDHTPEAVAQARRLYECTLAPVSDIMALLGLTRSNFYKRVKEWGWRHRRGTNGAFELARALSEAGTVADAAAAGAAVARPITAERRLVLAERIQSVIEREMGVVEQAVALLSPSDQPEAERAMRTLAVISRTVVDVAALNTPAPVTQPDDSDEDTIPSDIDAFRDELARRIHALIDAEQGQANECPDDIPRAPEAR